LFIARVVDAAGVFTDATLNMTIGGGTPPPAPVTPVPGAFAKTSPASAATNQSATPTLSWGASTNVARYEVCIDKTNNNACDGTWVSTAATRSYRSPALTTKTIYYWQVRAVNSAGSTLANAGTWWRFTTR
jgi:hypothetical protein